MHRSNAVTIFGTLNIVFSVFALLGVFNALVVQFGLSFTINSKSPFLNLLGSPAYVFWLKCLIPLNFLSFVLLLTTGIGLLRWAQWARALSVACGIYAIVVEIAAAVIDFIFFFHPFISQTTSEARYDTFSAVAAAVVSLGVGGWLRMIYAAALIRFMTRPKTVADFRQSVVPAV
jgi:hypothetical protein